jgi:hypothetical protein
MPSVVKKRLSYAFNKTSNGGEQLILTTDIHETLPLIDGDRDVFITQELTLCSYTNSATFQLSGAIMSSDHLRKLADLLDLEISKVKDTPVKER